MIFNCPECDKKYLLSASKLGPEGKNVRCVSCGTEWFQEPDTGLADLERREEETFAQLAGLNDTWEDESAPDEEAVEDAFPLQSQESGQSYIDEEEESLSIPQGVKPVPEERQAAPKKSKPAKPPKAPRPEETMAQKMMGYAAAVFLFFLVVLTGLVMKPAIVSAWPPAVAIYELAGVPVTLKGEGLAIEAVEAATARGSGTDLTLSLTGNIVNLSEQEMAVPDMKAVLINGEGQIVGDWQIKPPVRTLAAGENFSFQSEFEGASRSVESVNLTFEKEFL
jgi:predicted Zn finger-like uncharacterized protein